MASSVVSSCPGVGACVDMFIVAVVVIVCFRRAMKSSQRDQRSSCRHHLHFLFPYDTTKGYNTHCVKCPSI